MPQNNRRPSAVARFREFIAATCVQPNNILAMLRCYIDESGTYHTDGKMRRLTLGGCLATAENWDSFTVKWSEALNDENITEFHMSPFENFRGEFTSERGWNKERHKNFLNRLLDIIDAHVSSFVGSTYLGVEKIREAYYWSAKMAVLNLQELIGDRINDDLSIVFAAHPEASNKIVSEYFGEYFEILRESVSITVGSPSKIIPLQAADLIAYEIRKCGGINLDKPDALRYPMRRLVTSVVTWN